MIKLTLSFSFALALSASALAQQAQPDRWRGLVLGETTQGQAIALLGEPKEGKPRKIRIMKIGDWLSKDVKQELPCLRWEEVAGMKSVEAYFLNDKLVALDLQIKAEVRAAALETIYGVEFNHLISNAGRTVAGPGAYQVGAKAERAFLVAWCQVGFGEGLKRAYGDGTDGTRAGKVRWLQMYSRSVEYHDGADVLSSEPSTTPKPKN
ncbi:MAG TPA: hypothetical protein VKN18_19330 [Blastocatellia bacterium]|nr:hypothetical protein [Blastocatellia bacterium]